MKFKDYINDKLHVLLLNLLLMLLFSLFLSPLHIGMGYTLLGVALWSIVVLIYLYVRYVKEKNVVDKIIKTVDELDEKYYISEIIEKPTELTNAGYYYALKKACKSMNDKVSQLEKENKQFVDYINLLVHEIKTPVSAISLLCKNDKSVNVQLTTIDNYIEQVLYYTRMNYTEKDYYISEINLSDVVHNSIMSFKDIFLAKHINLDIGELDYNFKGDEKWLVFIINQILQNSIKYLDKPMKVISIYAKTIEDKIILHIKDNGIGIEEYDLSRVFDYGFTGSNRQKKYSTGMGLYICKKLCDKLGMAIFVNSIKDEYTLVKIIIPNCSK